MNMKLKLERFITSFDDMFIQHEILDFKSSCYSLADIDDLLLAD